MSVVSRAFVPVLMHGGICPSDERHFRGAAREVYGYLKLLAVRHGGFVFPSIRDVAKHTKKWGSDREPFSIRQCKRILRSFRALGILGEYETRTIHGRAYRGWQMAGHRWWAEAHEDVCEFKRWDEYERSHTYFQGNLTKNGTGEGAIDGTSNGTVNDTEDRQYGTEYDTDERDVSSFK
jgi:hypothetical protein